MEILVLGPLEARDESAPLALGAPRQRAVLAMLALDANSAVPVDQLIDGLWGEDPPDSARKLIQIYVSGLRKVLAPDGRADRISTEGPACRVRLDTDELDV